MATDNTWGEDRGGAKEVTGGAVVEAGPGAVWVGSPTTEVWDGGRLARDFSGTGKDHGQMGSYRVQILSVYHRGPIVRGLRLAEILSLWDYPQDQARVWSEPYVRTL